MPQALRCDPPKYKAAPQGFLITARLYSTFFTDEIELPAIQYLDTVASTSSLARDVPLVTEGGPVVAEIRERRCAVRSRAVVHPEARCRELLGDERRQD